MSFGYYPQQQQSYYGAGYPQQQYSYAYPQQQQQPYYPQQQQQQSGGMDQVLGAIVPQLFGLLTAALFGDQSASSSTSNSTGDTDSGSSSSSDEATATQHLQTLADNKEDVELFDHNDDGKIDRSELQKLASSDKSSISDEVKEAADWLTSSDGKKAFEKLDKFGDSSEDSKFDAAALKHVAEDEDLDEESGDSIDNGQDALSALNDTEFLKSIATKTPDGKYEINFTKLQEVADNKDDKYTDEQAEAAEFIMDHDDLKKKLDGADNNSIFLASDISRLLNDDSSLSDID